MKSVKIDSLHMELFSGKKTKNLILDHLIEILLLVLIIGVSIAAPSFLKSGNILNILRNAAMKGVIAYGMCLVIISGEIDLSVGSQVALSGVLAGFISKGLAEAGIMPIELGALVGIAAATLVALLTGLFHAWARQKFNMPSFIITLATLNVMYGFAAIVCGGFPIANAFPTWYAFLGSGRILGIPFPAIVFILIFLFFWFLTEKTDLGISVWKTRIFVMCMVQLMCVLSGIMNSAQVRSATFTFGRGWETQIISSVVIGGTSMLGGIGTIWGTLIGVLFTGVITNAMTLLNVNEFMQYVINGALMFFAVMFNTYMTKKRNN